MASRGESRGRDARPDSRSTRFPYPIPQLARPAPNPMTHLEGHLARWRQVTWWWVSPIKAVSPISPQPPRSLSRVVTRRLHLESRPGVGGGGGVLMEPAAI